MACRADTAEAYAAWAKAQSWSVRTRPSSASNVRLRVWENRMELKAGTPPCCTSIVCRSTRMPPPATGAGSLYHGVIRHPAARAALCKVTQQTAAKDGPAALRLRSERPFVGQRHDAGGRAVRTADDFQRARSGPTPTMTVVPASEKVELMMATSPLFVVRDVAQASLLGKARRGRDAVSSTQPATAAAATSAAAKVRCLVMRASPCVDQQLLDGTITTDL